jgi:SagB-type dehydrogenase family enzyme
MDYNEMVREATWPASRLYHEQSKLTEHRARIFAEGIELFSSQSPTSGGVTKQFPMKPFVELPRASKRGPRLFDMLRTRRSQQTPFDDRPISLDETGAMLELSFGETNGGRAWPSAGALYPLDLYVVALNCSGAPRAIHFYDIATHGLSQVGPCPDDEHLSKVIFADNVWPNAAMAIVLVGVFERCQKKYDERGYRFVLNEAGHVAQNFLLIAQALGLGGVSIGGYCEDELTRIIGLDPKVESPVYVMLFGARR